MVGNVYQGMQLTEPAWEADICNEYVVPGERKGGVEEQEDGGEGCKKAQRMR